LLAWGAAFLALVAGEAAAHASLVDAVPADGAALERSPSEVVLRFDEPVVPLAIRLGTDRDEGREVRPAPGDDASVVRVPIATPLREGRWVMGYRVTSADSHVVAGAIAFAIGANADSTSAAATPTSHLPALPVRIARTLASLLLAGVALNVALVAPGFARARSWLAFLAVFALLSWCASLVAQVIEAGNGVAAIIETHAWHAIAASPLAWAAPTALLACLAIGLVAARREPNRAVLVAGAVVLVAAAVAAGHGATAKPQPMAPLALFAHVATAAFWFGGLAVLVAMLRTRTDDGLRALERFSTLAMPGVALLVAGGIAFAWIQIPRWHDLAATGYGRIVSAKVALTAALLGLAATNRFRLLPRLRQGDACAALALKRNVILELALVAAVAGLAAALARTAPPPRPATFAVASASKGTLAARLRVQSAARAASIEATLTRDGRPFEAAEVRAILHHAATGTGPLERALDRIAPGRYRWQGMTLGPGGTWRIELAVRVDAFSQETLATSIVLH
jgi:copper transport protein